MKPRAALQRWLSNPVLVEWSQSASWCDLTLQRDFETILRLTRILAVRAAPMSVALLLLGFWLIGEIPGGREPLSWRGQLMLLLPFVGLAAPYVVLRLGLWKPKPGTSVGVRLRVRMIELVGRRGRLRVIPWSSFDAFDFGRWQGYDLVKLRLRERWPMRGRRPRRVLGLEIGSSGIEQSAVRQVLQDRGLQEEPLGDPTP